jgi:hypothetical protein
MEILIISKLKNESLFRKKTDPRQW